MLRFYINFSDHLANLVPAVISRQCLHLALECHPNLSVPVLSKEREVDEA